MKENKIFGKRFCLFMMIAYLMTLLVPGEVFATSGGTISTVAGTGTEAIPETEERRHRLS